MPKDIGFAGLYRGVSMYTLSQILFAFAQFTAYDAFLGTRMARGID